jgi:hypothetical protein
MCVKWNDAEGNCEDEANVALVEDNGVRWYAVTIGKRVGVFNHWCVIFLSVVTMLISPLASRTIVSPLVTSISGSCSSRYSSRTAAEVAFGHALATHAVHIVD